MRVLRFLRPIRSSASALEADGPGDSLGLDAFATEAPPPAAATHAATQVALDRLRLALAVIGLIALAEAVPAFFWLQGWMNPPVPAVAAAAVAAPMPLPPGVEAAAAPCTTAPPATAAAVDEKAPVAAPPRVVAPAMVAGLVAIEAPLPMHIYADGKLIGTTEADTVMLPVGTHELEMVSESAGFRARRTVTVQAGRTMAVAIEAPRVPVHVNALPWAEVIVDNQRIGDTPIGNLQLAVGSHEFVFRHPELGERRATVLVTLKEPVRVSMDLRKR
jgi:hypothetical protein